MTKSEQEMIVHNLTVRIEALQTATKALCSAADLDASVTLNIMITELMEQRLYALKKKEYTVKNLSKGYRKTIWASNDCDAFEIAKAQFDGEHFKLSPSH